jgi:hypothetical protein
MIEGPSNGISFVNSGNQEDEDDEDPDITLATDGKLSQKLHATNVATWLTYGSPLIPCQPTSTYLKSSD